MNERDIARIVSAVIGRTPQWIRDHLGVHDAALRLRAEESLAAMIAAALQADIDKAD